jgi:hypothetical protein
MRNAVSPLSLTGQQGSCTGDVGAGLVDLSQSLEQMRVTRITTAVRQGGCGIESAEPWHQPLLRLVDAVVGISVRLACKWIGSFVIFSLTARPVR